MPAAAQPKPLTKTEWLAAFAVELERLRGLRASKLVDAIALQEWVRHHADDPEQVAQAWAKRTKPDAR